MEEIIKTPKIKICGITSEREAEYLNEAKADYAGFVFCEKSRRNVSFARAEKIMERLFGGILKVAVTVSPTIELIREIEKFPFDILQVHGYVSDETGKYVKLPVWRAVNITNEEDLKQFFLTEAKYGWNNIKGYVADGAVCGGGKPFDWERLGEKVRESVKGEEWILAGGLREENVKEGIRYFRPDVVDVSSGVEENGKKSREKIIRFIRKVREDG